MFANRVDLRVGVPLLCEQCLFKPLNPELLTYVFSAWILSPGGTQDFSPGRKSWETV